MQHVMQTASLEPNTHLYATRNTAQLFLGDEKSPGRSAPGHPARQAIPRVQRGTRASLVILLSTTPLGKPNLHNRHI